MTTVPRSVARELFPSVAASGVYSRVFNMKQGSRGPKGCNCCASLAELVFSFIACFISLVIAPLREGDDGRTRGEIR